MRIFATRTGDRHASPRKVARRAIRRGDIAGARSLADMGPAGLQALVNGFRGRKRHAAALLLHEALDQAQRRRPLCLSRLQIREPVFARLLRDRQAIVRCVSVRIVGYTGQSRWVPEVSRVLSEDADAFARCRAADALGDLGAVEAVPLLTNVVEDRLHPARYHAVRALGRLGPTACSYLASLSVGHPDEVLRREAAETIARFGDDTAWDALLAALAGPTPWEVRKTLVDALGRSRADRALTPLVERLARDGSPTVREAAAAALATLGDARCTGALLAAALHDPFTEPAGGARGSPSAVPWRHPVREAAADALLVFGGTERREEARSGQ